jgi:hypothetical protein
VGRSGSAPRCGKSAISFTTLLLFSHGAGVRLLVVVLLLACSAAFAHAQEQERKMLDRILKPDMELQNPIEKKQFTSAGAVETKKARTKMFFFFKRKPEKEFVTSEFYAQQFTGTRESRDAQKKARTTSGRRIPNADVPYSTAAFAAVREANDSTRTVETAETHDARRQSQMRGKSQKALSQQNPPMTIDQVRELLNKNK